MKIVKNVLGIGILFLILQQCAVSQENDDAAAAAAVDADTAETDVDTAETIIDQLEDLLPADDPVQVDTQPIDDAAVSETEEASEDQAEIADGVGAPVVCIQHLNEECVETDHCCQPEYICEHTSKKCKSSGSSIPENESEPELINIQNDIIE